MKLTTDILHHSGTNPDEKRKLETEQEAWRTVEAMAGGLREEILYKNTIIAEKDQALNEKDQALSEKDQIIAELMLKLNEKK